MLLLEPNHSLRTFDFWQFKRVPLKNIKMCVNGAQILSDFTQKAAGIMVYFPLNV